MFIYIVASAYSIHMMYWITKSLFRTIRVLRGINTVVGTALEITHTALELKHVVQSVSASSDAAPTQPSVDVSTETGEIVPDERGTDTPKPSEERNSSDILPSTEQVAEPNTPPPELIPILHSSAPVRGSATTALTLILPDESIMNDTYSDVSVSDVGAEYYSDVEMDIVEEIAEEEDLFVEDEKRDGEYYLGHYFVSDLEEDAAFSLFLLVAIQSSTFLKYPYHFIEKYMELYIPVPQKQMEIMRACVRYDNQYRLVNVVLKTHWIRLIQRHWKRTYAMRKRVLIARMSPYSTMYYSFTGRYPEGYNNVPSLHGMLSVYAK